MGMFDTITFKLPEGSAPLDKGEETLQTKALCRNMDEYDFTNGTFLLKSSTKFDDDEEPVVSSVNKIIPFTGSFVGYTLEGSPNEQFFRYFRFTFQDGNLVKTEEVFEGEFDPAESHTLADGFDDAYQEAVNAS